MYYNAARRLTVTLDVKLHCSVVHGHDNVAGEAELPTGFEHLRLVHPNAPLSRHGVVLYLKLITTRFTRAKPCRAIHKQDRSTLRHMVISLSPFVICRVAVLTLLTARARLR